MDYRIQKTKEALSSAMITLLEKQNFSKITVNEICEEAMVSRSAFYSHFNDKYALIEFIIQTLKDRVFEASEEIDIYSVIHRTLSRVANNSRLLRNLFLNDFDAEIVTMMQQSFQNDLERLMSMGEIPEDSMPGPIDVVSAYFAAGFTSAVHYWIRQNQPYSVDEMTDILINLLHWV